MPYLILPSKRTRQPAGAVRVLPEYQASLLSLVLPRQAWGLPITGATADGGQLTAVGASGVGYNPRGGSNGPRFTNTSAAPDKSVGYPLTLIAFARLQNSPGSGFHTIISLANAADYFVRVILTDASGVAQLQCNGSGGTGSAASAASAWARNADNSFAGVVRTAIDRSVYVGGRRLASNTTNIGGTTNLNRLAYGAYDGAGVNYVADGLIYTAGVWLRAFPDEEVAEFGRYPYLALAPDLCRIWFDAGAGGDTYSLTASNLAGTSATLQSATLTQNHGLTAANLAGAAATLQSPALTQNHVVTASNLTGAAPALGSPALTLAGTFVADNLTGAQPVLGTPALTQQHSLTVTALTGAAATLGTPALTQNHVVTASNLTSAAPVLGAPTVVLGGTIVADNILGATPIFGSPALTQQHSLTATPLLGASAILGSPAFGQQHMLTGSNIVGSAPTLGTPDLTSGSSGTGATAEEVAAAVLAALNATAIPVNVQQVHSVPLAGVGSDGNPWRAA